MELLRSKYRNDYGDDYGTVIIENAKITIVDIGRDKFPIGIVCDIRSLEYPERLNKENALYILSVGSDPVSEYVTAVKGEKLNSTELIITEANQSSLIELTHDLMTSLGCDTLYGYDFWYTNYDRTSLIGTKADILTT